MSHQIENINKETEIIKNEPNRNSGKVQQMKQENSLEKCKRIYELREERSSEFDDN